MAYTLSINGDTAESLEALGFEAAVLKEDMRGGSELVLTAPQGMEEAGVIEPFQRCVLFDGDDEAVFVGWLDKVARSAVGNGQKRVYTVGGPWRWFERSNFVQGKAGLAVLAGAVDGEVAAPQAFNLSVAEIVDAVDNFGFFTFSDDPAAFEHETPTNFRADVSCAEAMATLMTFAPTAFLRWDYTTPSPGTAEVALKLGAIAGTADWNLSVSGMDLSRADMNPRYELLAEQVEVFFIGGNEVKGTDAASSAGDAAALGSGRKVLRTYDITSLNNLPAAGIAAVLANWHQRLHIDGTAVQEQIDWTRRPGQVVGFSGSAWGDLVGYRTTLHTVTRDLFRETQTHELGVMPALEIFKVKDFDAGRSQASGAFMPSLAGPRVGVDTTGIEDPPDPASLMTSARWTQVERCDGAKAWVLMTPWVGGA
jgi:hypothetical protein